MGVLLLVGARLGDKYGKRRMFLIGIAGFTLASLAAGLSADPVMLIAARLVQGGFGALLIPQGIGLLIGSFNREQMRAAFTAFGPVMGASAILGPILAGFIISANIGGLTWRPIFLINIVLANRGFTAGMLLGLAFFAAINGLACVISLFFQTGLGMTARAASVALSPFMIGIIIASFAGRPLLGKLGRVMVVIGLGGQRERLAERRPLTAGISRRQANARRVRRQYREAT